MSKKKVSKQHKGNGVLADISCLLPTFEEVKAAIKEIGKKSTAPDKETPNWMEKDIENGINWALNYVVKKSQGNSN